MIVTAIKIRSNISVSSSKRACASIKVVANLKQEEVVAMRSILIADRVTGVSRDFRADLEDDTRREIAGTVLASKPIGGECDFLIQWLFKTELSARAIR